MVLYSGGSGLFLATFAADCRYGQCDGYIVVCHAVCGDTPFHFICKEKWLCLVFLGYCRSALATKHLSVKRFGDDLLCDLWRDQHIRARNRPPFSQAGLRDLAFLNMEKGDRRNAAKVTATEHRAIREKME